MRSRIGTCSLCGGDVMGHSGAWHAIIPPPPPTCTSCGAVSATGDPVIQMRAASPSRPGSLRDRLLATPTAGKCYTCIPVILLAALTLTLTGCAYLGIKPPKSPERDRRICLESCDVFEDFAAQNVCRLACPHAPRPMATATAVTPTTTMTPSQTTTPLPAETAIPVGGTCIETHTPEGAGLLPVFATQVDTCEREWIVNNTSKWKPSGLGGSQFNIKEEADRDPFYFDIVSCLRGKGLDSVVAAGGDGKPSGEIAVAARGDDQYHEQYSVLVSSRDIRFPLNGGRANGFMAVCRPRGFIPSGPASPTATPTPGPVTKSTCPPFLELDANRKNGSARYDGDTPGKFCWLIDLTGKFDVEGNGKKVPCNKEKWRNCGVAGGGVDLNGNEVKDSGDLCEPAPGSFEAVYQSVGYNAAESDYAGRVCGPEGSPFTVTVRVLSSGVDKDARPLDLSRYLGPFTYRGVI